MLRVRTAILAVAALAASSQTARGGDAPRAKRLWFAHAEVFLSAVTDTSDRSTLSVTLGPAVKVGRRFGDWGAFVSLEYNAWLGTDIESGWKPGSFNIGFGGEYMYAKGWVRASLALGPSILLWDTTLDQAGSVGIYVDLRPAGIRWEMNDWLVLMFDPASVAMVAPVLGDPAMILIEYRATFTTEFRW